jgi:ABC-type sugar transport system ATPase subunit
MSVVLETRGLTKAFGGLVAVNDVSLQLHKGELLALIGPNGAGKSTCFNMLMGQLTPTSGEVFLGGESIHGLSPRQIWRKGVGRTFQITATYSSMTVIENVQMALLSHYGDVFRFTPFAHRCTATRRWRCWTWSAWPARPIALCRSGLWRSQAHGTGHRTGTMAAAAADGRTHRRHGPEGARGADGTDRRDRRRAAASACCSPNMTWTSSSPMPTGSWC